MAKRNHKVGNLSDALSNVLDMFFTSWVIMLLTGTLLGNENLWTPAYWEVFGALYLYACVVGFATRVYYDQLKIRMRIEARRENSAKQQVI